MTKRINFKLDYNDVTYKFGSELTGGKLFYALKDAVASIVQEFSYELFWNDDDSKMPLESCVDLNTAIDYSKFKRTNPNCTPCVLLTVLSTDAAAGHQNHKYAANEAIPTETDPVNRILIKQHLRNLFNSALQSPWTMELRSAMRPLFCPRTKRLQAPSEICAAEIAVELAKLEKRIPGKVRDRLKKIPIKELRTLMNVELFGSADAASDTVEQTSQSTDPKIVAATAVVLAVELSLEQPWVEDGNKAGEVGGANEQNEDVDGAQMCPEFQKQLKMGEYVEDPEIINQLREEYDVEFEKVHTMICPDGKEIYVLTSDNPPGDAQNKGQTADKDEVCSDEDDYEKEVDELDPDCWMTKRATSILERANQRLDAAYAEVLYDSPEEFLKRAKADEIKTVLPVVSEKERLARMRQRLRMLNIAAPALSRSSIVEMERQIASLDVIEYEERPELRRKWPSTRTNIAALILRTLDGIPEEIVQQLEQLSAGELARIVLLNCKDRLTATADNVWSPSTPQAMLYVCAAAAIYPKEIRHGITATINKGTATIEAKYEKKYGKDCVQKDNAARAVLSLELAKYMSYDKSCAFERLMLPAQLKKESENLLKHQKWANLIKSFNMTNEMRSIEIDEGTLHDEIAAKLYDCVRNFNSKTLGNWERSGITEYAADLYDEWMERVYKKLKWEVRTSKTKDPLVTMCSPPELAAIMIIGAAAELSPSDMHIDMAEYNIAKSVEMHVSEAAQTFAELREAVSNEGAWADTSIPAREFIPWLDRLAYAILERGLEILEPVLAQLPHNVPQQETHEEEVHHVIEQVVNPNALLTQQGQSLQHLQNDIKLIVDENPKQSEIERPMQPAAAPLLQNSVLEDAVAPASTVAEVAPVTSQEESQPAASPIQSKPQLMTSAARAADIAAREHELKIREKALQLKEEVFEICATEFDQKMKQFESKYYELNRRVTELDSTEDMSYFEETVKNMDRRLKKIRRDLCLREEYEVFPGSC
ncbi:hypothetical protein PRIPAC_86002 [Pristionchus pacificus]|uniref:Uncharacterized protein n=1 Tax=Pristionchus pacificus TaxID=54126 RepID=A0A2A6BND4_PRIPA|nr:hypothetical protein PRIPAC_86002 [Pristionchus pacificus]|eukprot:PDM67472.1 hypothetical protein PRIPAC_48889 [Pristionchus pacificus]